MKRVSIYLAIGSYAALVAAAWAEIHSHPAIAAGLGSHLLFFFFLAILLH